MIDFNNTEVAFKIKNNISLRKAQILFKSINNPSIARMLNGLTAIALKGRLPVSWLVKPTLYVQFVGGESLEECNGTGEQLWKFGVSSILDYSVEGKDSEEAIEACFKEVLRGIEFAATKDHVAFTVFKPTGIAHADILEKISSGVPLTSNDNAAYSQFVERVNELCRRAAELNVPILIDAEDFCYQKAIDDVVELMMERYNRQRAIVYNTLQMYRTDRLDYLHKLYSVASEKGFTVGAKFVRGAYMEKERERASERGYPSPINESKAATDEMYDNALIFSVEHLDRISIFAGTHNEDSVKLLVELVYKYSLSPNDQRIWFSQLYGMSDNLTFNLAAEGFNVAKYVPYGPVTEVLPYLIRRASENTSVAGQSSRELNLINQEIKRRKSYKQW